MKKLFNWYLQLSEKEIKSIWKEGILTVDTNVLLDLYRYHNNTQKALLDSLNGFKGRTWLCYQVADEFFRNRNTVILSATGAFNEAERLILEVRKSVEEPLKKLKNNRIIPDDLEQKLETDINSALDNAEKSVKKIRDGHPDYRKKDLILDNIFSLFDTRVGEAYDKDALPEILKEAKRRKDNKIPPGFKDSGKDGDRPYGDYIVWRQIIDYIKKEKKPLIFVTSEQKEDWWEKASGQITGPLYELIKEFYEETGQRFLFYRTDRFLEFSIEQSGKKTNSNAVAEIRDIVHQRQKEAPVARVVDQNVKTNTQDFACGTIKVELLENVYKFNCSGHFEPQLNNIPEVEIKLVSYPTALPGYLVRSGTGTNFDFHIHVKSMEYEVYLPIGHYIFEYEARIK